MTPWVVAALAVLAVALGATAYGLENGYLPATAELTMQGHEVEQTKHEGTLPDGSDADGAEGEGGVSEPSATGSVFLTGAR